MMEGAFAVSGWNVDSAGITRINTEDTARIGRDVRGVKILKEF